MSEMRYPEAESSFLEFKREVPKNEQIIKTIIGYKNRPLNCKSHSRNDRGIEVAKP